jgi:hypothetical protein
MYFDNVAIYMEQNQPPGSYGDSCAETSRYFHLLKVREKKGLDNSHLPRHTKAEAQESLAYFRTDTGYVRHHNIPEDWKEGDFTSDQAMPLFMCYDKWDMPNYSLEMMLRLKAADYKTGNGDIIALPFVAVLYREPGIWYNYVNDTLILGTALVLKYLPFRWNEVDKKFERTIESSADWLNFLHAMFNQEYYGHTFVSKLTKKLFTKEELYAKLEHYYKPEPNSAWLLLAYKELLEEIYK